MIRTQSGKSFPESLGAVTEKGNHRMSGRGKFRRRALEAYSPLIEECDDIAHNESLGHIMRDDESREIEETLVFGDHGKNGIAPQGIKSSGGFIEQDNLRLCNDCAGEGKPLLHAAGERAGVVVQKVLHFELTQRLAAPLPDFLPAEFRRLFQREGHIFQGRQRVEKRIALE